MVKAALKHLYAEMPFKQPLFKVLRMLHPPERVFRHLHFKGVIEVDVPGGGSFRMHHHGYQIENQLFWLGGGGWEPVSSALWRNLARDARAIMDVGANTGVYTLVARCVNPAAGLVALEPVERVFRKLQANIALNGYAVHALHAAASQRDGTMTIYDMPLEHVVSVSLNRGFYHADQQQQLIEVPVAVRSLDSVADELGWSHVDLLKIDTETHEPEVLAGARRILERDRPSMLIEVLNDEVAARVEALIGHLGYLYFNIDERRPPVRVPHLSRSGHFNFLVCRPEVAARLGLS